MGRCVGREARQRIGESLRTAIVTGLRWFSAGILIISALTGCSNLGADQAFTYRRTRENRQPEQVLTYSYDRNRTVGRQLFFKDAYEAAASDAAARRGVRNRILYELMGAVDDHYFRYTRQLRAGMAGKGVFSDSLGIATSLASTAAGGQQLKTVLSAISTGVQGVSQSIDANALMGSTVEAIRLQMDATRAAVGAEMITKMGQTDGDYPLEAGLRDIIRYYDAGTVTSGVAGLSRASGKQKTDAEGSQLKASGIDKLPSL